MAERKISVIVPVFRVEKYIQNCLDSILSQSFPHFELILVDDGSDDGCGAICEEYKEKDGRIVVVHQKNGGLAAARNTGIEIAKGEYLAFIDSDDCVHRDYLRILYELCTKNNCEIAICGFLLTEESSILLPPQRRERREVITGRESVDRSCTGTESLKFTIAWNKLYHRSLFDGIRYPAGKIHEDDFTTWKLLWKAKRVAMTNLYLYYYLQRDDSIMGKKFNEKRLVRLDAYEEKIKFLHRHDMNRAYEWLAITFFRLLWETAKQVEANIPDSENILYELSERAGQYEKIICDFSSLNLVEKNRIVYPFKNEAWKNELMQTYGTEWIYRKKEFFLFPFGKVFKGSKIALYGAGEAGKTYCLQILTTGYGEVVLWVDEKWRTISRQMRSVRPIDAALRSEYDVLVLAISDGNVAEEIKDNLIGWGVPEGKIVWESPRLLSENVLKDL